MKLGYVSFLTVLLAGSVFGQGDLMAALPACAVDCFAQTITASTCADPTDLACLCIDQPFMLAMQGCQAVNCTIKETLTSTNATVAACGFPAGDVTDIVIAIPVSFGTVALLMVILRVLDRTAIRGLGLSWDDYLIIVAVIAASVMNYVSIPMGRHGLGRDLWTIEFEDISMTFLLLYVIEIFYMFAEMCVQLSLLVFYLRVFPKSSRLVHVGSWVLAGIVTCFGIANTFTMVFQCTPIPFFWDGWAGEMAGTCIDINLYSWIRAAIEIALDVAIMALPLPSLLALQLSRKKKLQTLGMFALGFVITIVSCLRLQSLLQFSRTQNPTFDNAPAVYWSVLECDIFIMCACLPSIRSIMVKVAPKVFGSTAGDSKNSGYKQGSSHTGSQQLSNLTKAGNIVKKTDVHIYREMSASDEELFPHSVSGQA